MKLSELIDYLNLLDKHSMFNIHHEARHSIDTVVHDIINHGLQFKRYSHDIIADANNIDRAFEQFTNTVESIKNHINELVQELEPERYRESMRWFNHESIYETNDYILNRRLHISPEDQELMLGRILRYTDWRLPGLCLRPGQEKWVEHLVPLDPMYLVDNNLELLEPAKSGFHEDYQRRLRLYTIKETLGTPILGELPTEQFGYVFAYNFFNFRPLEIIEQYLKEFWDLLRPGGVVMMTFNDCDYAHGVALSEKNFMCYTPGKKIQELAEAVGFDINDRHHGEGDVAWIELQKPGVITSIRGGQALAKIVKK